MSPLAAGLFVIFVVAPIANTAFWLLLIAAKLREARRG